MAHAEWCVRSLFDGTICPHRKWRDARIMPYGSALPFAGDYLYVSSLGSFAYGVWTDWRDTVQGTDPRESPEDENAATADVLQCRTLNTIQTKKGPFSFWSGDLCPHAGGIDQNIYGDTAP